jgi:hypothetical protein
MMPKKVLSNVVHIVALELLMRGSKYGVLFLLLAKYNWLSLETMRMSSLWKTRRWINYMLCFIYGT